MVIINHYFSVPSPLEWLTLFISIKNIKSHILFVSDALKKENFDHEAVKAKIDIIQKEVISLEKSLREFE